MGRSFGRVNEADGWIAVPPSPPSRRRITLASLPRADRRDFVVDGDRQQPASERAILLRRDEGGSSCGRRGVGCTCHAWP